MGNMILAHHNLELFSIAPCKVIALNCLCLICGSSISKYLFKSDSNIFPLFFAMPFRERAIDKYSYRESGGSDTYMGAIKKR